jgi:DNA-binding response OmpR family regulator
MNKILVIDDSLTDRTLIRRILESKNYQVVETGESDQVDDLVETEHPDLILLDIILPGTNGYEICRNLKGGTDTKKIPIIFVSARKKTSDVYWGKLQGADDYLTKPVDPAELLTVVEKFLGQTHNVQKN